MVIEVRPTWEGQLTSSVRQQRGLDASSGAAEGAAVDQSDGLGLMVHHRAGARSPDLAYMVPELGQHDRAV
jgi:hypothetical protein